VNASSTAEGSSSAKGTSSATRAPRESSIHSENGFGSSSQVPGAGTARAAKASKTDASGTSDISSYLLVGVLALAGVGLAGLASRGLGRK